MASNPSSNSTPPLSAAARFAVINALSGQAAKNEASTASPAPSNVPAPGLDKNETEVDLDELIAAMAQVGLKVRHSAAPTSSNIIGPSVLAASPSVPAPSPTQAPAFIELGNGLFDISGAIAAAELSDQEASPGDRWYVVTRGKEVGWFRSWTRVKPMVDGVSGACHHKCPEGRQAARKAFEQALVRGTVRVIE